VPLLRYNGFAPAPTDELIKGREKSINHGTGPLKLFDKGDAAHYFLCYCSCL